MTRRAAEKGSADATPTASRPAASPSLRSSSTYAAEVTTPCFHPRVASPGAAGVPEIWHQPGLREEPHRPGLGHVDHHGPTRLASTDEGDDAVIARVGVLHRALLTADRQRLGHGASSPTCCAQPPWRWLSAPRSGI